MKELLKTLFNKYNISYSEDMIEKLDLFYNIVVEENKKFNLTAITEKYDFAVKHILDCAMVFSVINKDAKIIDVGAGAGFPSIVLKIIRPDLNFTMLDSLNKRVKFLNETVDKLQLANIKAYHDRAEDFANKHREEYDIAIARAVAPLNTLSEYCLPLVKVNGNFIAMKGSAFNDEIKIAQNAINLLGGKIASIQTISIAEMEGERANIVIEKNNKTPQKYPRGKNLPRLKPLC